MSNYVHEVLKRARQLEREAHKRADDALTEAARTEKRADETTEQCIARLHAELHPAIRQYYGMEEVSQ